MKEFIHTFSLRKLLSVQQLNSLETAYGEKFFYNSSEHKYVLSAYSDNGVRVEIIRSDKEKKYDKEHRCYRAEIIVTPGKLIAPGNPMNKIFDICTLKEALGELERVNTELISATGIDFLYEAKLHRVDVAKDIITPSDEHSREILRLAKLSIHKNGYNLWIPSKEEIDKTGWLSENSTMFRNHSQEVNCKIYNKRADVLMLGYSINDHRGLIRFELSLKRKYMKKHSIIFEQFTDLTELQNALSIIMKLAPVLLEKHLCDPLWSGAVLSRELQKKYIKVRYKSKKAKIKKMLLYRNECNKKGIIVSDPIQKAFVEIGISPLYTSEEFGYIPSIVDLLAETTNDDISRFLKINLPGIIP